ncbi:S-layer homology domain-containing protein [Paenibacillus sp. 1781tsa1]|uniref:S-layer homology domain-containing protein n=1 Tax=Paenibacillus sp. 1781tsa1 TaxID=2953810 RepID=UPI0020A13DBA|nr:S-layer homology domain-containing protein [Paenibacillus sp. 1781tsa1]MCP1182295.1 S-layer homology domain-containing protein [Paenibacillus sp. 1781tsa1]
MNQDWKKVLLTSLVVGMLWGTQFVNAAEQTGEATVSVSSVFTDQNDIRSSSLQAVKEAVEKGLISGYPDGSFHPDKPLTRREMAVLLAKASQLETDKTSNTGLNHSDWAAPYIEAIRQEGWMTSDTTGNFRANDPIRREELASILVRVTGTQGAKGGQQQTLADESMISGWAKEQVHTALKLGLLDSDEGKFESKALVERQDIAKVLVDVFQTGERTASLTALDGDIAYVDGRPFVISQELQRILNDENKEALQNAVITYDARTRNLSALSEIQITQAGTLQNYVKLNLVGTSYQGVVTVSSNHVALKADNLSKVVLKPGVSAITIDGDIDAVTVDTTDKVTVLGSGTWKEVVLKDVKSIIQLPASVKTNTVILPKGGVTSQIIRSAPPLTAPSSNTVASNSNSGSGSATPTPTPTPTPEPEPPVIVPPSPENQPPVVQSSISDMMVYLGEGMQEIDLGAVFTDADEDELSYEITEIDPKIATADIQGSKLKIVGVATGQTTVTLKAADGKGGSVSASFTYVVKPVLIPPPFPPLPPIPPFPPIIIPQPPMNHAPEVVKTLPTVGVELGTVSKTVDLADVFTDMDGDILTYTAQSSDPAVVEVSAQGDILTLDLKNVIGSATVTVKATDPAGKDVETTFTVKVEDPDAGKSLFISEVVWGEGNTQAIELYNPTSKPIELSQFEIKRSDIDDPITFASGTIIAPYKTMVIADDSTDFPINEDEIYYMSFNFDIDQPKDITLILYQISDGEPMDTAILKPAQSLTRTSGNVHGDAHYDGARWIQQGENYYNGLGNFTSSPSIP